MELSAVIFPDTVLSERMCIPLVPVFAPLVYLQPVENDPAPGQAGRGILADLLGQSFCTVQVPAPLGEDRERFLRLIADIRGRRDDYAAQLGHLTLAGISTASRKKTETKSSIVASILTGHGIKDESRDHRNLLLWQSRLLLKLAEMHAADQEDLQQQIRRIREKEDKLFAGLREEKETSFVLPAGLDPASMDPAALQQQRKAWTRLLVLGGEEAGPHIVLSRDRDGMDLLAEEYEKASGTPPQRVGQLILPAAYPAPELFIEQVRRFREEGRTLLARVRERLGIQTTPAAGSWFSPAEGEAWISLLARFFPAEVCGRVLLTLFACPGSSVRRLTAETFAPEELQFLPKPESEEKMGMVLGVLEDAE